MAGRLHLLVFFIAFHTALIAQSITGVVTDIMGKPLVGANVIWEGTNLGTVTDSTGSFSIEDKQEGDRMLILSYIGFTTEKLDVKAIKHWEVQLIEDVTLAEVNIIAKGSATRFAEDVAKVEVLGVREIQRAACCSLAGCFSTNSNVDANVTNVVTDTKELRILGLSGVYNQVLVDGLPLIQGLAYPYGPNSYRHHDRKNLCHQRSEFSFTRIREYQRSDQYGISSAGDSTQIVSQCFCQFIRGDAIQCQLHGQKAYLEQSDHCPSDTTCYQY
ncbi:MAG: carboxypeptidase-like regulatory domain-containing protein [Saprospiraceae bacterium]|nr:carboxypeptidase-like regulatory domain-containing protein [Saprospiraceae bacterium]